MFPVIFAKYLKTSFLQNISGGCFCIKHMSWSFFAKISITDLHRDSNTSLDLADSSSIMEYLLSLDFLIHFTSVPLSFVRVLLFIEDIFLPLCNERVDRQRSRFLDQPIFNPIQDEGEASDWLSPSNFSKVGISTQSFLTFSFNPLATLLWNAKAMPRYQSQIIEL